MISKHFKKYKKKLCKRIKSILNKKKTETNITFLSRVFGMNIMFSIAALL